MMKKICLSSLAALLVLALCLPVLAVTFNDTAYPLYVVQSFDPNGYCYLYDRADDINGNNLGRYNNGANVRVISSDSKWCQVVTSDNQVGYIHAYALTPASATENRETCTVNSTSPNGYCYMYSDPDDINGRNLGRYNNGEVLEIINWDADRTYAQVMSPTTKTYGYVRKTCLSLGGTVPVMTAPPVVTAAPVVTAPPVVTATPALPAAEGYCVVYSSNPVGFCYLYQSNNMNSTILARYENGVWFRILAWNAGGNFAWVQSMSDNRVGYIPVACLERQ